MIVVEAPSMRASLLIFILLFMASAPSIRAAGPAKPGLFTLVIHGGAGVIDRKEMTPEKEAAYHAALDEALRAGHAVLKAHGTSLDAVIVAIRIMEDSPLFNAGKGAVLNAEGFVEMDASLMDGATRKAGAVGGVKHIKNPIELARLVMDKTPHVLLAGNGAEVFAKQQGITLMPPEYFITEHRKQQLERVKKQEAEKAKGKTGSFLELPPGNLRFGTVGAVALDQHGNLAAGTSTGGMVNKRFGRLGDSPIIGAGTYADNATCAVSGTGHGEYFIRCVVSHDIAALMEYKKYSVKKAAEEVVLKKLKALGGTGGVIALDRKGNFAQPFNTDGMHRGYIRADGKPVTAIFKE
jgi:beta-aspartyl-peptidase (threonine type)